jgi:hypothetical protein
VIEQYVQQLRSVSVDQRRAAIIALARAGDAGALSALAHVYRTDPDPALRELALKAGRHIQRLKGVPGTALPTDDSPPLAAYEPTTVPETLEPAPQREPQPGEMIWPVWGVPGGVSAQPAPPSPDQSSMQAPGWQPSWAAGLPDLDTGEPTPAPQGPPRYVNPQRQQIARGQLRQAFSFATVGDAQNALAELARAVQTDPALTGDESARRLAAELLSLPPQQAMPALLRRISAGELDGQGARQPILSTEFRRRAVIIAVEIPLLLLILVFFILFYVYRVQHSVEAFDIDFILVDVLRWITPSLMGRALPVAAGSLVAVLFFVGITYVVGLLAHGTGTIMRFASVMIAVQIVVFLIVGVGMLFVPFGIFVPTGEPGQYLVQLNLGWIFIGGVWVLGMQAYAAARSHHVDLVKGGTIVVVGFVASAILGGLLGVFRGSLFG